MELRLDHFLCCTGSKEVNRSQYLLPLQVVGHYEFCNAYYIFFFHCLTSIAIVYYPKSDVDLNQLFLIISRCDCESAK